MRALLASAAIVFASLAPVMAADVTRHDVPKLDIFGVRLYDASDAVLQKLEHIDGTNSGAHDSEMPKPTAVMTKCVPTQGGTNPAYAKRCPGTISLITAKFAFTAELVEDLPEHPGVMRAYSITLHSRNLGSSYIDLTQYALKKYGTATLRQGSNLGYCAHPASASTDSCEQNEPMLKLTDGQTLVIQDYGYLTKKSRATGAYLRSQDDRTLRF